MNLVLLGPPGAGKGTIAGIVREKLGIPHISTGDLFRAAIKNETPLGLKVKEILASGELVPDSVTVDMVKERIAQSDCKNGMILDGFPRTVYQADELAKMVKIDHVINFSLSEESVVKRLSGRRMCVSTGKIYHIIYNPPKVEGKDDDTGEPLIQRDDDKEDAIRNRLKVYQESTEPLITYYKEKGLLRTIDASAAPDAVAESFLTALNL
ncbi:MAG: adenylate kinase [Sphaerochaetaceae bacterium]|nr:adenylate kinase [Sphaerochaetaceae bacterium]